MKMKTIVRVVLCFILHDFGRVMSNPNDVDRNCSVMTAKISGLCEQKNYRFYIWDEEGVPIYKSSVWEDRDVPIDKSSPDERDEREYSFCYDPSKCYSIEFDGFFSSECPHEVLLNGTTVADDVGRNLVRFGNCSQCKEKIEVILSNQYFGEVDTNYTFFAKGIVNHALLAGGHSSNICMDSDDCNILTMGTIHPIRYYVVKDNKINFYEVMPKSKMFGQCSNCTTSLLVYPAFGEPSFNYTLQSNDYLYESAIKEGKYEITCVDATSNCYNASSNGKALFSFYENEIFTDDGFSYDYSFFGSCDKKCRQNPVLHSTERGKDMISAISYISDMMDLQNIATPEYHAACWLIYDDARNLNSTAPHLLQRYIVALMYYSTEGWIWNTNWGYLGTNSECDWYGMKCDGGQVIEIKLGKHIK